MVTGWMYISSIAAKMLTVESSTRARPAGWPHPSFLALFGCCPRLLQSSCAISLRCHRHSQRHESGVLRSSSSDPRFQLRVMTLDLKHTHLPPRLPGTPVELKTIIQIVPKTFRITRRYSICRRSCERGILQLINPKLCRSDSVEKPIY
jgi:hypothetical protein